MNWETFAPLAATVRRTEIWIEERSLLPTTFILTEVHLIGSLATTARRTEMFYLPIKQAFLEEMKFLPSTTFIFRLNLRRSLFSKFHVYFASWVKRNLIHNHCQICWKEFLFPVTISNIISHKSLYCCNYTIIQESIKKWY